MSKEKPMNNPEAELRGILLIKLFEQKQVRTHWDEAQEKYYFSIIDVVTILTEQSSFQGGRNYWKVLKYRLLKKGNETVTNCNRLKMLAQDGKKCTFKL